MAIRNDELLRGTLDLLILSACASGPLHGHAIARWIHEQGQEVLRVEEGTLYPALHRLERGGDLRAKWGRSENNRRARFYSLSRRGRKRLAEETEGWRRLSGAVAQVLAAGGAP
jgi:transcriptional regulator